MAHLYRLIRLLTITILTAISLPSMAETIPAGPEYRRIPVPSWNRGTYKTVAELENACREADSGATLHQNPGDHVSYYCRLPGGLQIRAYMADCKNYAEGYCVELIPRCPDSSWAYQSYNNTCTRPDCPEGQER